MSQALGALGNVFGGEGGGVPSWMKMVLGGLTGAGEIGNIMADRQRGKLMSQEQKWARLTPQQLAGRIRAATAPLEQGLVQGVGNTVQAQMGERGLAQAPGIFSAEMAQALAPYHQRNQEMALQAILRQMGLPIEMAGLLPGQTDLAPLLKLLLGTFPGKKSDPGLGPIISSLATGGGPQTTQADIPDWTLPEMPGGLPQGYSTSTTTNPFGQPLNPSGITNPFGGT
jgi:hypothetical protein